MIRVTFKDGKTREFKDSTNFRDRGPVTAPRVEMYHLKAGEITEGFRPDIDGGMGYRTAPVMEIVDGTVDSHSITSIEIVRSEGKTKKSK